MNMIRWDAHNCLPLLPQVSFAPIDALREMDAALQAHGLSADESALVMGGNPLRVAQQVWSADQNGSPT
jgi:microsomal dipeptidase-like Zn-dependent dipeptidase